MPGGVGRRGLAVTSVGDLAIFAGGYTLDSNNNHVASNEVDIFNVSTGQWVTLALPAKAGEIGLAAASIGHYAVFAGGGMGTDSGDDGPGDDGPYSAQIETLDLNTAYTANPDWTTQPILQVARESMAAAVVNNQIVLAGGDNLISASNAGSYSNAVDILTPLPAPVAGAASASSTHDAPVSINVLANDSATAPATIVPDSVTVVSGPADGTAVPQSDGTIVYTPVTGFAGIDTFTYTVADSTGTVSDSATVTVLVSAVPTITVAPPANQTTTAMQSASFSLGSFSQSNAISPFTVTVNWGDSSPYTSLTLDAAGTIPAQTHTYEVGSTETVVETVADSAGNISASQTFSVIVNPVPAAPNLTFDALGGTPNDFTVPPADSSDFTITTLPANGTASFNAPQGQIVYTPTGNSTTKFFVGDDQLQYTFQDAAGVTSTAGTITFYVGAEIGNPTGPNHYLTYNAPNGATAALSLNAGSADVYFSGSGTATIEVPKGGGGRGLSRIGVPIPHITTQYASISSPDGVAIQQINLSNTSLHSTLTITGSNRQGALTLGGISSLGPLNEIDAPSASSVGQVSLIQSVRAIVLGNAPGGAISVAATPRNGLVLQTAGDFDASLNLSSGSLAGARIGGSINYGAWNIDGKTTAITVNGTATGWALNTNNASVGSVTVRGRVTASNLSTGNLNLLSASSLIASNVWVGSTTGTTLSNVTLATLGRATLGVLQITSNAVDVFSSTVIASAIHAATLGFVDTAQIDGLAAASFGSVEVTTALGTGGRRVLHGKAVKTTDAILNFQIEPLG